MSSPSRIDGLHIGLIVGALAVAAFGAVALLVWTPERAQGPGPGPDWRLADSLTLSELYAGDPPVSPPPANTYERSAFNISEGKRLYQWFNCNGCHANGGGDIGPPLMDDKWIYGSRPENIHATILQGRPNGMPSFRRKMTEAQAWQITAYVRSMSGQVPSPFRAGRNDDLQAKTSETLMPPQGSTGYEPATSQGPQ